MPPPFLLGQYIELSLKFRIRRLDSRLRQHQPTPPPLPPSAPPPAPPRSPPPPPHRAPCGTFPRRSPPSTGSVVSPPLQSRPPPSQCPAPPAPSPRSRAR